MEERNVSDYLRAETPEGFWCWSDSVDSITWYSGSAIAFHQEVERVIDRLKEHGLPRFEELVLVLSACRQNWNEKNTGGKAVFMEYLRELETDPMSDSQVIINWVAPLLEGLDAVHRLYAVNPCLDTKVAVCERVFEKSGDYLKPAYAHILAKMMARGLLADEVNPKLPRYIRINEEGLHVVKSPIPGIYRNKNAQSAGAPFVTVGQKIKQGSIVARVEGLIAYDLQAGSSGRILAPLHEDGDSLEVDATILTYMPERMGSSGLAQSVSNLLQILPSLKDVESVGLRRQTGLDVVPASASDQVDEEWLPDQLVVRDLISSLIEGDDHELSALAMLARDLMGTMHVPRDLANPDDRPRGGFSDIANRGNIDRLLLSELAQDDDVLVTRVALNEALYLRRETPPRQAPRKRSLFIDTSIRMWGIPRVFAHAVALALAATVDKKDRVEVWSIDKGASDEQLLAVDLRSREGLVEQLARLSSVEHPGAKVVEFLNDISVGNSNRESVSEPFLIIHPNVLDDSGFRKTLAKMSQKSLAFFVVTVNGDGQCKLLSHSAAGFKELRSLRLDPAVLSGGGGSGRGVRPVRSERSSSLLREDVDVDLPLILRLDFFPLLISCNADRLNTIFHPKIGLITRTKKHQILHFYDPDEGAVILHGKSSGGLTFFCSMDHESRRFMQVSACHDLVSVLVIDLQSGGCETIRIPIQSKPQYAIVLSDTLILICDKEVISYGLYDGIEQRRVVLTGKPLSVSDRFVRCSDGWYAITDAPLSATRLPLTHGNFSVVVEHPDYDTPVAVEWSGRVALVDGEDSLAFESLVKPGLAVTPVYTSQDKAILVFKTRGVFGKAKDSYYRINLGNRTAETYQNATSLLSRDPRVAPFLENPHTVRKKYQSVVLWQDTIGLVASNCGRFYLDNKFYKGIDDRYLCFSLAPESMNAVARKEVKFSQHSTRQEGYRLRSAKFDDGSVALLDSRGMLHLKSIDPDIPEITLVLNDGPLSGWISTGEFFGEAYFIGNHESISAMRVYDYVAKFCGKIREVEG
ncbi:MAG: hypothetical protein L3J39_18285 [Verrucomicrobiales bacterium]|nr:hypothetical protein [Verrucomicrobiales bacterium]